jgi:hypothetical protein
MRQLNLAWVVISIALGWTGLTVGAPVAPDGPNATQHPNEVEIIGRSVRAGKSLAVELAGGGGFVAIAKPESSAQSSSKINLRSLLAEMADRDSLARFPQPEYRQMQASSYNRASVLRDQPQQDTQGWFADSDGVSCLREETIDGRKEYVIMEHDGPGCVTKLWTPFFYYDFSNRIGPRIRVYLDGADKPTIDEPFIELVTRNAWPESYGAKPPKKGTLEVPVPFADFTARAGNLYLPIPFAKNCKITLTDKPFYNIVNYRAYPAGTKIETFSTDDYQAALDELKIAGDRLLQPPTADSSSAVAQSAELAAGQSLQLTLPAGPRAVDSLTIELDVNQFQENPSLLRAVVLEAEFDDQQTIWCPLGDFFGCPNRLNPFKTLARQVAEDGKLLCRWVMPYQKSARIRLVNFDDVAAKVKVTVETKEWQWSDGSMHLFAAWRPDDVLQGNKFVDWNFVDIRGKGVLVGDQWTVLNLTDGWWGEGDEKIYVDDSYDKQKFPDHFGTGTEDYYGWAGGVNPTKEDHFSHPFLANISVGSTPTNSTRGFNICQRTRSLDAIPFHSRLVLDMEASPGVDQRNAWDLLGYSSVTWWYAVPGATSNRDPQPDRTGSLMSLEELQQQSSAMRE